MSYSRMLTADAYTEFAEESSELGHTGRRTLEELQPGCSEVIENDDGYFGDRGSITYKVTLEGVTVQAKESKHDQSELESIAESLLRKHDVIVPTSSFQDSSCTDGPVQAVYYQDFMNAVECIPMPEGVSLESACWDWESIRRVD